MSKAQPLGAEGREETVDIHVFLHVKRTSFSTVARFRALDSQFCVTVVTLSWRIS